MNYNYPQQILDGGLVQYRADQEVYSYPVAPGYQVTFVNSASPIVYKKTMFYNSPQPQIDRLRMIPDQPEQQKQSQGDEVMNMLRDLSARMEAVEKKVNTNE